MSAEARHDLQHAFDRLREASFPHDSIVSDELSDLHAALAEYDGHVAGIASSLLGGAPVDDAAMVPDDELRERLEAAARGSDEEARANAQTYLAYFELLDDIIAAARRYGRR